MNSDTIIGLVDLCQSKYDDKTWKHVCRVANYAVKNVVITTEDEKMFTYLVALCHDLIEDTDVQREDILSITGYGKDFELYGMSIYDCVRELTKPDSWTYEMYIKNIKEKNHLIPYVVKLADMKDHFMQKETLTDKLKEKYLDAIGELL